MSSAHAARMQQYFENDDSALTNIRTLEIIKLHRIWNFELSSIALQRSSGFTLQPVHPGNSRKAFSRRSHELISLGWTVAWCPRNLGQAFSREPQELAPPRLTAQLAELEPMLRVPGRVTEAPAPREE